MRSHRHSHRRSLRRACTVVAVAFCVPLSTTAVALAVPATDAASPATKIGDTPADFGSAPARPAPKIGDTPADFGSAASARDFPAPCDGAPRTGVAGCAAPTATIKAGDTPVDYPGASRAVKYDPPETIIVARPERTIVREADDTLPTILAGLALVIALGGTGYAVVRMRALPSGLAGGSR